MMRSIVRGWPWAIEMNDEQLHTLVQLQAFLEGILAVDFAVAADESYAFIARTVRRLGYRGLKQADKGMALGRQRSSRRFTHGKSLDPPVVQQGAALLQHLAAASSAAGGVGTAAAANHKGKSS